MRNLQVVVAALAISVVGSVIALADQERGRIVVELSPEQPNGCSVNGESCSGPNESFYDGLYARLAGLLLADSTKDDVAICIDARTPLRLAFTARTVAGAVGFPRVDIYLIDPQKSFVSKIALGETIAAERDSQGRLRLK